MKPETIGILAGLPVEIVRSYWHPNSGITGGMVCGMPTTWIRWGGGPWWVQEGGPGFRSPFQIRDWLAIGPWSPDDAVELWARWAQPQPTEEEAERDYQEAVEASITRGWQVAHDRFWARHRAAAWAYAVGLGVLS